MRFISTLLWLFLLLMAHSAWAQNTPFLFKPDIYGDQVVFTSEGDLWLGSITSGTAQRITSAPGVETDAHFSPDGKLLAFTAYYDGNTDVYVMPVSGGAPKRLTFDPYGASVLGWTPDGKNILFKSRRDSPTLHSQLFSVPVAGGMPTLLPIPWVEHAAMNRDGRRVAYVPVSAEWQHWFHYRGGEADHIWLTDILKHTFRRLGDFPGVDTTPVWVGDSLYCVSERDTIANLFRLDPQTGRATIVTHYTDFAVSYPSTDGKRIVFQHGNGLAVYDPATNRTQELFFTLHSDRIHTRPHRIPLASSLNSVDIGPTGKRVVVEARGQMLSVPVEHGDARPIAPLPGSRSQFPAWSPDGKQIAFVSDRSGEEQLWVAPAEGLGAPRQLTRDHKGPLGPPRWSPDGRWIAVGDHEMRVLLVDAATGATTLVDQSDRGFTYESVNTSYRFSPDSNWLTYSKTEPNWNDVIYLYNIPNKQKTPIASAEMNSFDPAFDATGKYLLFFSERSFDPAHEVGRIPAFDMTTKLTMVTLAKETPSPFLEPNDEESSAIPTTAAKPAGSAKPAASKSASEETKVDLDRLPERLIDVPLPAGRYGKVEAIDNRIFLLSYTNGSGQLLAFDIKKKQSATIISPIGDYDLSADHKKLLLMNGKEVSVVDATTGPISSGTGHVDMAGLTIEVQPEAEWKQIFNEAWRIARDFFYDPNMYGLDWEAVRRKYQLELPAVADRSDLNHVLGDMIAELNVGHAYVGGGDSGDLPRSQPMGYLGADLEPVPGANAYRIVKLYEGDSFDLETRSPLLTPGIEVKPGDYILAVEGQTVRSDQDIQALLIGAANRIITLTVNSKPTLEGAREVRVKPLGSEGRLRYYEWVASRREYVRKNGGDNLAYIHIPDMGGGGMAEFNKHYYADQQKDGIIYDVRNNGGGYISAQLLVQMASKPYSWFKPRYGASWTRINWGFAGDSVALCNQYSGSNAEEFCDGFQRLKLGPVVGVRTWGGEVGSGGGYRLIDGGAIYIPNYGEWVPEGSGSRWVIEGAGVQPDIVVEQDPAAVLACKDPQLDRAIAYLKAELAAHPIMRPVPPPFPIKAYPPLSRQKTISTQRTQRITKDLSRNERVYQKYQTKP